MSQLEKGLLSFLLVASFEDEKMLKAIFPTFVAIARSLHSAIAQQNQKKQDLNYKIRVEELIEALYHCGIPMHIAERNARAFMVLRPDFDLRSPKHRRLRQLLEYHQQAFLNAYSDIVRSHGKPHADAWLKFIREQDIFFARICQLPADFEVKYLFS